MSPSWDHWSFLNHSFQIATNMSRIPSLLLATFLIVLLCGNLNSSHRWSPFARLLLISRDPFHNFFFTIFFLPPPEFISLIDLSLPPLAFLSILKILSFLKPQALNFSFSSSFFFSPSSDAVARETRYSEFISPVMFPPVPFLWDLAFISSWFLLLEFIFHFFIRSSIRLFLMRLIVVLFVVPSHLIT